MTEKWLEIPDEDIDVEEIMQQIRDRVSRHGDASSLEKEPAAVAEGLWQEMVGEPVDMPASLRHISIRQRDCDIVPRHYVIDWRIPVLGPIHAVIRRIINAEIRRFLLPSLKKQSQFNRKVRQALRHLAEDNARLRQELEELRGELE